MLRDDEFDHLVRTKKQLEELVERAEETGRHPVSDAAALAKEEIESILELTD